MIRFFIILIFFFLNGCVSTQGNRLTSERSSNILLSDNQSVQKTKLNLVQNKIRNNFNKYKFIQWECYKSDWLKRYKKLIFKIGYFTEFPKFGKNNRIGMLVLNVNEKKKLAMYSHSGVQFYWNWGGEKYNNYQIIIHPSGNGWLYDFENATSNEQKSPKENYDCKLSETKFIGINKIKSIINELNNIQSFGDEDLLKILQIHLQKCFKSKFPTSKIFKNHHIVTLQIFISKDGVVNKVNFVDKQKYEIDLEYKKLSDFVKNAVVNCKHLPIPKNKIKLFKSFIMDFDPKFIY